MLSRNYREQGSGFSDRMNWNRNAAIFKGGIRVLMGYDLGDIVEMRKVHPCGSVRWEVIRIGMDFRMKCLGCGRIVMLPRRKFERAVKRTVQKAISDNET